MREPNITISNTVKSVSNLQVGVTITQVAPDKTNFGTDESRRNVNLVVRTMPKAIYNVHTMGFGITNNVINAQGVYNWKDLDRRLNWLNGLGVEEIMLTFWSAPDHMLIPHKHPKYKIVAPEYEDAYADLVYETLVRYESLPITRIQIWNELKGYGTHYANWDIVSYTRLYNKVYNRIRKDFPNIKIAGPYLILDKSWLYENLTTLNYWYDNIDGANAINTVLAITNTDQGLMPLDHYLIEETKLFRFIPQQIKGYAKGLEYWSSENYLISDLTKYASFPISYQACFTACQLYYELLGGVNVSLCWGLQGDATLPYEGVQRSWCYDTRDLNNPGEPTLVYDVYAMFYKFFGPGTEIVESESTDPKVLTLASHTHCMVINTHDHPIDVFVEGQLRPLGAYETGVCEGEF